MTRRRAAPSVQGMYPARADLPWDDVEGRVVIALPRRRHKLERFLARLLPSPENVILTLEGTAAAFWRLADGTREIEALAETLAETTGDARARLLARPFAARMAARGLITLHPEATPAPDTRRGLTPEKGFHARPCRSCRVALPIRAAPGAWWLCPRCRRPNRVPRA